MLYRMRESTVYYHGRLYLFRELQNRFLLSDIVGMGDIIARTFTNPGTHTQQKMVYHRRLEEPLVQYIHLPLFFPLTRRQVLLP